MDRIQKVVAGVPSFSGLSEAELAAVRKIAVDREFSRGELIFSDGDQSDGFYVIVDGRVKIFKMSADGKEQILHIFGTGEPFGEVPMFSGQAFPANAQTIARSRLLFFPRKDFIGLITENPSLALNMLGVLSRRLRQFTRQIENLSLKEVPERLAAYLVYLSDEQENADRVVLPISKGQLASLLGTSPETLSRIFGRLSGDGLIEVSGREIRLHDREELAYLAEFGKEEEL